MNAPLQPAFADPSLDSAQNFRSLLEAMANPGKIIEMDFDQARIDPLNQASLAALLVLTDFESPLYFHPSVNQDEISQYLTFHCGTKLASTAGKASFAFFDQCPDPELLSKFPIGTAEYPDQSATLIIQVDHLEPNGNFVLTGPGINGTRQVGIKGLNRVFLDWLGQNNRQFPLGVDVYLTQGTSIVGLPRTTRILEAH